MIPWVDIILILILLLAAVRGYRKGFIGAIRGVIGQVLGLLAAWLTTPLAVAWAEEVLGLKTLISAFLYRSLPENIQTLLAGINRTATSLQALKEKILDLPMPQDATGYLQKALEKAAPAWQEGMTPASVMSGMLDSFANTILSAIAFLILWGMVAWAVRGFLGLFTGNGGIAMFGVADGILGMAIGIVIGGVLLTLLLGAFYPLFLIKAMEAGSHPVYSLILESRGVSWMAAAFQSYILPWFA